MTKIWLKLQLHFSQKTTTKTKLKSAVKINTGVNEALRSRRTALIMQLNTHDHLESSRGRVIRRGHPLHRKQLKYYNHVQISAGKYQSLMP